MACWISRVRIAQYKGGFVTSAKRSRQTFPTVVELSAQMYQVGTKVFDKTFRGFMQGSDATVTDQYFRACTGLAHPIANLLIVRDVGDVELLSKAVAPFCGKEFPSCVFCLGCVDKEVDALLTRRGFQLAEELPVMALDIEALHVTELGDEYTLQQVEADGHDLWVDIMAAGYELPREFADLLGPGVVESIVEEGEEYRYFLVFHGDRPVATATNILRDGIVEVYNISTLPDYRGRGLGGFATGEPLRLAADAGYKTSILQASQMGAPVYRRLGYESFGVMPFYVRIPGS
ncbi:MAG: GNAT family N-acetyltransferase [Planctomycetota bacterium]|nr:GNAT family N-acetyltransferase [Planctomycetota bacterium]